MSCVFCEQPGGELLWQDKRCRVIAVDEPDYPGFCRVIWSTHVREMSDLTAEEQAHCMKVVFAVEATLRELMNPHKINLASLGNLVPHVHWHVIPRFEDDRNFPNAVWGKVARENPVERTFPGLAQALSKRLFHALA